MKKTLTLAAAAFIALTSYAQASTIDVFLGTTSSDVVYGTGGTLAPNVDLTTLGGSLVLNSAVIVNPAATLPGQYVEPTGSLYGNSFLAVKGLGGQGSATFTLSQNVFGFTWGSIDSYNSLVLTDSRGVAYTIAGADILAQIAGSIDGQTQTDIIFSDSLAHIVSAVLISTANNSFEAANFATAAVPLPPAMWLFIAALAGLFVVARNNKRNQSI